MTHPTIDPMTQLCDVLTHGVVAMSHPVQITTRSPKGLWLACDPKAEPVAFPRVSAALRTTVQTTGLPLASAEMLGALHWLTVQKRPVDDVVLSLPFSGQPSLQTRFLKPALAKTLMSRALMVHEERRQMLGLSARTDPDEVSTAIHRHFVLPRVAQILNDAPDVATRVQVTDDPAPSDATKSGVLTAEPSDALSSNPFALAIRTGFFGPQKRHLARSFRLSPGRFGAGLRRSGHASAADLRLALAIPQFHLFPSLLPQGLSHA